MPPGRSNGPARFSRLTEKNSSARGISASRLIPRPTGGAHRIHLDRFPVANSFPAAAIAGVASRIPQHPKAAGHFSTKSLCLRTMPPTGSSAAQACLRCGQPLTGKAASAFLRCTKVICTFSERPHTFCPVELRDRIHAETRTSQSAPADENTEGRDSPARGRVVGECRRGSRDSDSGAFGGAGLGGGGGAHRLGGPGRRAHRRSRRRPAGTALGLGPGRGDRTAHVLAGRSRNGHGAHRRRGAARVDPAGTRRGEGHRRPRPDPAAAQPASAQAAAHPRHHGRRAGAADRLAADGEHPGPRRAGDGERTAP